MKSYTKEQVTAIAKVCHSANRAFCETLCDFSQLHWDAAPEWQKDSAFNGVLHFLLNNGNVQPEDSHKSWMAEKVVNGWVYGETKDEFAKTHPCMVEYTKLPLDQRRKDYIFLSVCAAMTEDLTRSE